MLRLTTLASWTPHDRHLLKVFLVAAAIGGLFMAIAFLIDARRAWQRRRARRLHR